LIRATPDASFGASPHAIIEARMNWFHQEFHFSNVMIHSKIVVVDPFGSNPVVMTGSHNLGPKASQSNDDNLLIIKNAPGLAAEYAVNILGVYGHYKWLFNPWTKAKGASPTPGKTAKPAPPAADRPTYDGNKDSDKWQDWQMAGENLQLTQFLMGSRVTKITPAKARVISKTLRPTAAEAPRPAKKAVKKSSAKRSGLKAPK
jgi:phosphatidylserine/phosphatidylglycerophosphate/cardiolipin synthase-like enzyme